MEELIKKIENFLVTRNENGSSLETLILECIKEINSNYILLFLDQRSIVVKKEKNRIYINNTELNKYEGSIVDLMEGIKELITLNINNY